jgi:hypothetical protein
MRDRQARMEDRHEAHGARCDRDAAAPIIVGRRPPAASAIS